MKESVLELKDVGALDLEVKVHVCYLDVSRGLGQGVEVKEFLRSSLSRSRVKAPRCQTIPGPGFCCLGNSYLQHLAASQSLGCQQGVAPQGLQSLACLGSCWKGLLTESLRALRNLRMLCLEIKGARLGRYILIHGR